MSDIEITPLDPVDQWDVAYHLDPSRAEGGRAEPAVGEWGQLGLDLVRWQSRKNRPCFGALGDFVSYDGESKDDKAEREARAKDICARCSLLLECIVDNFSEGTTKGTIVGGTNEDDRKAMKDSMNPVPTSYANAGPAQILEAYVILQATSTAD